MIIDDALLQRGERRVLELKKLYASQGYRSYRMSKFEEYDLYANNKEFLVSDRVLTFTDPNGKLMALKPDVTLSIIKNSKDLPEEIQRVFYNENVYRVAKGSHSFGEILQTGLECFGAVGEPEQLEVLLLAAKSLQTMSPDSVLQLSDLSLTEQWIGALGVPMTARKEILHAVGEKNLHEISTICARHRVPARAEQSMKELLGCHGTIAETLPKLRELFGKAPAEEEQAFLRMLSLLQASEIADRIRVDFSVVDDINYYNGIIFKGYIEGIPDPVLSGGQYDRLMQRLDRRSKAIGFAVYTDLLDRLEEPGTAARSEEDRYLNVALPKGRLGERVYGMFAKAGYDCPSILEENRKLIFENPEKKVRYFWVKPSDVAIYVERGAADVGVAGKDILLESEPAVYEMLDLKTGICRMCVAGPKGMTEDPGKTLRVATKFSNITRRYFQSVGREIELIELNGSIEIAPILGLSDVIVDIVETGRTLRENDLEVKETILPISARLIANRSSYEFKSELIETLRRELSKIVEETDD